MANEKDLFQKIFEMYENMVLSLDSDSRMSESFIEVLKSMPEVNEEKKSELIKGMEAMKKAQESMARVIRKFLEAMQEMKRLMEEYDKLKEGTMSMLKEMPDEISRMFEERE